MPRLLTWNLSDLDVTAPDALADPRVAFLAAVRPDVLCLQKVSGEVDPERADSGLTDLAEHLGMAGVLGRAAGERLHVAVLWAPPWKQAGPARRRGPDNHRNQLVVDLTTRDSRLRVGCVHLPVTSVEDQLHDLDLLLHQVDEATVVGGDWNATGADASYDVRAMAGDDRRVAARLDAAALADAARVAGAAWQPTWRAPDTEHFVRIDGFRLTPGLVTAVTGYRVHTDADSLSLHRPVEVVLDLS